MFSALMGGGPKELETEPVKLFDAGTLLKSLSHLEITLPSNTEWRNDNYFRLVQLHRQIQEDTVLPTVKSFIRSFEAEMGFKQLMTTGSGFLPTQYFVKDHLVPMYIHSHPKQCADVLNSKFVEKRHLIIENRSQCLGAVTFMKVMEKLELCGSVAQTHIITPPTTAYFASMIALNPNIDQLLIFSTGAKEMYKVADQLSTNCSFDIHRKSEYEEYFQGIGACNVTLFSEQFAEITPENRVLHNVIAVMACPPSSNTAVVDPIDISISRDGDVSVLYALTEDYEKPQIDAQILKTQRETLLKAMSMPQIQAVVYETHSRADIENGLMVDSVVNDINQWAADKHHEETQRLTTTSSIIETEIDEIISTGDIAIEDAHVQVPLCDLYEVAQLPDTCPDEAYCLLLKNEGVYLAFLKRKEITRLDPKYMISMAEARGLFGRTADTVNVKHSKKKVVKSRSYSWKETVMNKPRIDMDRLTTHTLSSKCKDIKMAAEDLECSRYAEHLKNILHEGDPLARVWWKALLQHIQRNLHCKPKFPALHLSRPVGVSHKIPYSTNVKTLEFTDELEDQMNV